VDTFFHTSRMSGHKPMLGLSIPYTWGMGSKGTDWMGRMAWLWTYCIMCWLCHGFIVDLL